MNEITLCGPNRIVSKTSIEVISTLSSSCEVGKTLEIINAPGRSPSGKMERMATFVATERKPGSLLPELSKPRDSQHIGVET